jgi:hypothetical protein
MGNVKGGTMKGTGIMKGKLALSLGVAMALLIGCADQRKETKVLKEDVISKQMIEEGVDYLYLPSVVESPRTSTATRPYWMGEAKRVRFVYGETELKVYEVETDQRFIDNPTNKKPILRIPIANKDFKCAEDAYGSCLPTEKERDDISWNRKRFFQPNFEQVQFQEVNFLPIELTNLFENCYAEKASDFVDYKIDKDSINFSIEKTFQTSGDCLGDIESLSDVSFNVRYHYSFARLDKISSPDYKPFLYSRAEENTFGYFNTRQMEIDVDNNAVEKSEYYHLNRWNPNRKVVYHLSKAFDKPENAAIKQSTYDSVQAINNALKAAGTKLTVELKEHDASIDPGDLRYNSIVMVEDPQATGIIGYGPSAADPRTGEIVHARTVMYLGTMKKYLQSTYDELVEEKLAEQNSNEANGAIPTSIALDGVAAKIRSSAHGHHLHADDISPARLIASRGDFGRGKFNEKKIKELVSNPTKMAEMSEDFRHRLDVLSRHTAYSGLLFNFHGAIEDDIDEVLKKTQLKPWAELSSAMRKMVVDTLMPFVWQPTLVHELGHNLGLRHNFNGSEDKENFYNEEEQREIAGARKFIGSSIMDYMYRTTNELKTMGKYDIAALRYAYAEKVETANGKLVSLEEMRRAKPELKAYGFCTDEHVDVNPACKRFDEGTNLTEISQHWIRLYEDRYKTRNFRNQRLSFSLAGDVTQIMFLNSVFRNFRLSFERYETIKNDFDLPDSRPEWESIPFLKDLKTATLIGGAFLTDILKVPDITCAIADKKKPNEIVAAIPLRELSSNAVTCFDDENVGLNPAYMVVGQGGKSYNSLKAPTNENPYIDQIDVRGIWIDKLMALDALLARGLGSPSFDEYTENYLHVPELKPLIVDTLQGVLLDKIENEVPFVTRDGQTFAIKFSYPLAAQNETKTPLMSSVKNFFGFGKEPIPFQHLMVRNIKKNLPSTVQHDKTKNVLESFSTLQSPLEHSASEVTSLAWGAERFYALKEHSLAKQLIARVNMQVELGAIARKELVAAAQKLSADPNAVPANKVEERVKAFGVDEVIAMLQGEIQEPAKLVAVLRELKR